MERMSNHCSILLLYPIGKCTSVVLQEIHVIKWNSGGNNDTNGAQVRVEGRCGEVGVVDYGD